jgi:hypothetical protein
MYDKIMARRQYVMHSLAWTYDIAYYIQFRMVCSISSRMRVMESGSGATFATTRLCIDFQRLVARTVECYHLPRVKTFALASNVVEVRSSFDVWE